MNPFPYSLDNKRYQTWNYFLKQKFGQKVYKVPLSLGTTCPNRDGSKGTGGCAFCTGGGGGTPWYSGSLQDQFHQAAAPLEQKWPHSLAIAYFQSYSNTYLPVEKLRAALTEALELPKTVGIALATRPDCLPPEILEVLAEYAQKTFLIVELGLQTIHDATAGRMNRAHSYAEFLEGYANLTKLGIPVCVHLINGLPGETLEMMRKTADTIAKLRPHSVKFHMLHIMKSTELYHQYRQLSFPLLTREEYVSLLCDQLERLAPETVIQRISGDPLQEYHVAPDWVLDKLWIRNALDQQLVHRNTQQGARWASNNQEIFAEMLGIC